MSENQLWAPLFKSINKVACGLCLPCYREYRLRGEYDADLCYLANLISPPISESTSTSENYDNNTNNYDRMRKVKLHVSRLTLRCEKEAQYDNRFGRAVFSSELKLKCEECY